VSRVKALCSSCFSNPDFGLSQFWRSKIVCAMSFVWQLTVCACSSSWTGEYREMSTGEIEMLVSPIDDS